MIVKIIDKVGERTRFYEADRVIVGGYQEYGEAEPARILYLESNEEGGSVTVDFKKDASVYVLNDLGRTVDRIWF